MAGPIAVEHRPHGEHGLQLLMEAADTATCSGIGPAAAECLLQGAAQGRILPETQQGNQQLTLLRSP